MEIRNTLRLLVVATAMSWLFLWDGIKANELHQSHAETVASQWTESDWIAWWENIEDLYLAGVDEEGIYWLLRHDLEVLGHFSEFFSDLDLPDPYPGWGGGAPDPHDPMPPMIPYSSGQKLVEMPDVYVPLYGQMPEEWGPLLDEHGLDPSNFGGYVIPPPPTWVAASISLFGTHLTWVPHPGTQVVGRIFVTVGGVMIIWIELGDDEDN